MEDSLLGGNISSSDGEAEEIEKLSLMDEEEIRLKALTPSIFDSLS